MKKRIGYLLLAFVTLVFATASCSDGYVDYSTFGSISGTVLDKDTGDPVSSALVTVTPGGYNTYTGFDGTFMFLDLEGSSCTLRVQKTGYRTNSKDVPIIPGNNNNVVLIIERR